MIIEDRKETCTSILLLNWKYIIIIIMWKNAVENHERRMDVKYTMKIVKDFKDTLTRQVNEAVRMVRCEFQI